ncbi:Protein CBG06552 [Caenorhabditis briggsae]|uniref:Protein CBG06552 n=1 Tax=Caenorhabditis briggsae TaxID=6238 RepID=A8X2I2_CAEBR|nr:Protein CBG06552 [Caenorhabditis briggsae]CAP26842.2 Protein CBG06552 [Caenorhabditis briggsae]
MSDCEFKSESSFVCSFYTLLRDFVNFLLEFEIHIAAGCILINSFHILVLTRKPMRSSSINIILCFLALSDLYSQFYIIEQKIKNYYENLEVSCLSGTSYFSVLLDILLKLLREFSRRSSTWLSFSIALIRTLVIQNPMNPKFEKLSNAKSGFIFILIIWLINLVITTFGYFQFIILFEKILDDCGPKPRKSKSYFFGFSEFFMGNEELVYKIYTDFDAIISKHNSGKTTKLVLCLTLTFFIAEFPLAVIPALEPYYSEAYGLLTLLYYFNFLFTIILSFNTSSHMIICLLMSSQYRENAKNVICCGFNNIKKNKPSVVSVRTSNQMD